MKQRYLALDAMRGLTIALMILVNTPGSWSHIYAPFAHADWHGVTPTDFVFPFFLFIVGSAMAFSFSKDIEDKTAAFQRVAKRSLIMFGIGLFLNAFPFYNEPLSELRVMGVLQRIALAYFLVATICIYFKHNTRLLFSVVALVGYWLLLETAANPYSLEGNLVRAIDLAILGDSHLYMGKGIPFDPEGLLSTLPAAVNVFFGLFTTQFLINQQDKKEACAKLVVAGIGFILLSLAWSYWMPINKSLWTSSYTLLSIGAAIVCLALFVWIIDIKEWHSISKPLEMYGLNPLAVYVLSWLWVEVYYLIPVADTNFYQWLYESIATVLSPNNASLVFAFSHVLLFWLVARYLYLRNIIIKI